MSFFKKLNDNYFAALIFSVAVYFIGARAGFFISEGSGFASVFWPPAGIAIMLVYYFGFRIWPGLYLGAMAASISNSDALMSDPTVIIDMPIFFLISGGATLQAVLIAWGLKKYDLIDHNFNSPVKIGWFYFWVGPLGSLTSATIACLTFWVLGLKTFISVGEEWLLWWISDGSAAIIFTTLIIGAVKFDLGRKKLVSGFIVTGLTLGFIILHVGKNWENERLDLRFNQKTSAAVDKLEQFVLAHLSLDNNLSGFISFRPELDKQTFEKFSQNNLERSQSIRSIAWIESFSAEQRPDFEQKLKQEHGPETYLWQTGVNRTRIPAKTANSYTTVKYIEPYDNLGFVAGHVIGVDENRKAALAMALETGKTVLSAPVILTSEPETISAATIYRAHFKENQLSGYSAIAIRVNSMINDIIDQTGDQSFYISLYDEEFGEDHVFKSYANDVVNFEGLKSQTVKFPILNRTWVITFTRTRDFAAANKTSQPLFIAIAGMIFASMFTIGIVIVSGQRAYLEKEVMERTTELEMANQAKSEFMANMSHDLRTPLNAIIGFSDIMKNQMFGAMGSEKYLEYTRDINQASGYLLSLINDILDYSAIAADKRAIQKEELDMVELVDECLRSLDPLINEKSLNVTVDFPDDYPVLFVDLRSIKQILINLISNSIKFTPVGGDIKISGCYSNAQVRFVVSDNGEGIEQEKIDKVFDPFARGVDDPHLSREGTGLGLAIVNSLVKLHKGSIKLESVLNEGTDVTIELPR